MGRWRRHLDPNIRKCQWLMHEDELLKAKFTEHGPQWSNISKFLDGRTAQQCRARWFQLCPTDLLHQPMPAAPRHGNSRKDRVERHRDGASIQASARQLLSQMEEDGAPLRAPPPRRSGAVGGRSTSLNRQLQEDELDAGRSFRHSAGPILRSSLTVDNLHASCLLPIWLVAASCVHIVLRRHFQFFRTCVIGCRAFQGIGVNVKPPPRLSAPQALWLVSCRCNSGQGSLSACCCSPE